MRILLLSGALILLSSAVLFSTILFADVKSTLVNLVTAGTPLFSKTAVSSSQDLKASPVYRPFNHASHQFTLDIPSDFIEQDDNLPDSVGVLLRHSTGAYPSFNVVVSAGSYDAGSRSLDMQEQDIVDQYALTGITDVEVEGSAKLQVNQKSAFRTKLAYTLADQELVSLVTIVSGLRQHYILTYIDRLSSFEQYKQSEEALRNSFASWADVERFRTEESRAGYGWWYLLLGMLLVAVGMLYRRVRAA